MKMNLKALRDAFRADSTDNVEQKLLWSNEVIAAWLNEAVSEAAVRRRLIYEASNTAVTRVALQAGRAIYPLHPSLYEIVWLAIDDTPRKQVLKLKSTEWMDRHHPDWRTDERGDLPYAVQMDTQIRLASVPKTDGVLLLEGYRLPLKPMCHEGDEPEIHHVHHHMLVHWALHKAFTQPDADGFDPHRGANAEEVFTSYFGPRPDADLHRDTRRDEPVNQSIY